MKTSHLPNYNLENAVPGDIFTARLNQEHTKPKSRPIYVNAVLTDKYNRATLLLCTPITSKEQDQNSIYKRYNLALDSQIISNLQYSLKDDKNSYLKTGELIMYKPSDFIKANQKPKFVLNVNDTMHNENTAKSINDKINKMHDQIGQAYHNYLYQKQHNTNLYQDKLALTNLVSQGKLLPPSELNKISMAKFVNPPVKPLNPDKYSLYNNHSQKTLGADFC